MREENLPLTDEDCAVNSMIDGPEYAGRRLWLDSEEVQTALLAFAAGQYGIRPAAVTHFIWPHDSTREGGVWLVQTEDA